MIELAKNAGLAQEARDLRSRPRYPRPDHLQSHQGVGCVAGPLNRWFGCLVRLWTGNAPYSQVNDPHGAASQLSDDLVIGNRLGLLADQLQAARADMQMRGRRFRPGARGRTKWGERD